MKALFITVTLLLSTVAFARGSHGGGHSYSAHSSSHSYASHSSSRSRSYGSRRTEHVSSYTRNGTTVRSYHRAPAGTGEHRHSSSPRMRSYTVRPRVRSASATTGGRDAHGRIKRSESAKHQFEAQTGYPHGRPGYVVDHKIALACGGADAPSNMQWQTVAEGKAKDKWERRGCGGRR